ncbi:SDR family oxidoreductase [Paenibacillus sp. PL2-23]|uniref:SDR family NAD(P)-dependent oxidoreductase n=1 Tax=Paenibacillus sp. PL2-23 TaxID=2100729 RepID=UPI0030FB4DB1
MKKTVLITGASGGIGYVLAYRFAEAGYRLVLVARSSDKLQQLARELKDTYRASCMTVTKDLGVESEIAALHKELLEQEIEVDVLVNNAGFGLYGEFVETDLEQELNMIDLNVCSLTMLTKLFVPAMVRKGTGGVLNVASVAAFQPGPLMAVYYATKAYVLSFSEALENELKGTGVTVTALCPGPTQTGFSDRANLGTSKLFKSGAMDVRKVADIGYNGFLQGKSVVIPGAQYRLLTLLIRFMPRKLVTSIVRSIQGKA